MKARHTHAEHLDTLLDHHPHDRLIDAEQAEYQAGSTQKIDVWIASCDHLASMTDAAFADWLEDQVWVQFPVMTPMSDILSEVIDRLRQLPRRPQ
jgi:hypothetical protein